MLRLPYIEFAKILLQISSGVGCLKTMKLKSSKCSMENIYSIWKYISMACALAYAWIAGSLKCKNTSNTEKIEQCPERHLCCYRQIFVYISHNLLTIII